jgi:hypothetical protein
MFQASLIEASPPSPILGSPRRSPKFPISKFTPIGYIEDQLEIKSGNNYQDKFRWKFSDGITIAFADVWNGDVNLERQLLLSKSENPRLENVEVVTALAAAHGVSARRMVEVAGARVSPKSIFEKISDTLLGFHIDTLPYNVIEASVRLPPVSASAVFSREAVENQDNAALTIACCDRFCLAGPKSADLAEPSGQGNAWHRLLRKTLQ